MIERAKLLAFFNQKGYPSRSNDEGWYEWITDETLKFLNAEKGDRVVYQCPRCATSMEVDPTGKPSAMGEELEKMIFGWYDAIASREHRRGEIMSDDLWKLAHAIAERMK